MGIRGIQCGVPAIGGITFIAIFSIFNVPGGRTEHGRGILICFWHDKSGPSLCSGAQYN